MNTMLVAYVLVCFWSAIVALWFLVAVLQYFKDKFCDRNH
jgi:hypothetical protein